MQELKVGDAATYRRNCDDTLVSGIVEVVYYKGDPNTSAYLFLNASLRDETVAYRLGLIPEDEVRVGHYVTIGSSRVIPQETVT